MTALRQRSRDARQLAGAHTGDPAPRAV